MIQKKDLRRKIENENYFDVGRSVYGCDAEKCL